MKPTEAEFCAQFEQNYVVQRLAKEIYRERYPGGMHTNGPGGVFVDTYKLEYILDRWRFEP